MKKILFCDDAHTFGGAQLALKKLIEHFSLENEFELYCVISFKNKSLYDEFSKLSNVKLINGYQVEKFAVVSSIFYFKQYNIAEKIIENIKPDVAIINLSGIEFGINYKKVLDKKNIKYISWLHNSTSFSDMLSTNSLLTRMTSYIRDSLAGILLINSHKNLVVVSESSYKEMITRGINNEYLITIENPIPAIDEMKYNKKEGMYKIGIFGRIQFCVKGQDQILKLINKYEKSLKNIEFHFFGDGPDFFSLQKNEKKGLIIVHGWIKNVNENMKKCDLILMPSRFEGLSLVFLEALALKKEILTSNIDAFYLTHVDDKFELDNIESLYKQVKNKVNGAESINKEMYYNTIRERLSEKNWFDKFKNLIQEKLYE